MKHIVSVFLIFLFAQAAIAQDDLAKLKIKWTAEIKKTMDDKGIGVSDPDDWRMESDSMIGIYARDTFLLERLFEYQLEYNPSTHGMVQAIADCEAGYDALLNKYYKMLLTRLKGADKDVLKKSQRNWIAFRDSEKELNYMLIDEKYSGGGTIQHVNYASRNLALTQTRVEELYLYLIR